MDDPLVSDHSRGIKMKSANFKKPNPKPNDVSDGEEGAWRSAEDETGQMVGADDRSQAEAIERDACQCSFTRLDVLF